MKFIIKEEKESEPKITLWLEQIEKGVIILKGKNDDKSHYKNIMKFQNGKFSKHTSAQLEGLETDENGKIKEKEL